MKDKLKNFTFMANNDEISNKPTIKILGMILRNNMDWKHRLVPFVQINTIVFIILKILQNILILKLGYN